MPVVPVSALMGQGLAELFRAAVDAVRAASCPILAAGQQTPTRKSAIEPGAE
jgi:hypothetical protein